MQERLLIIDDDLELFGLLQCFLKGEDFEVDSAATGDCGIEKAGTEAYALLVLDVMLPDMNGFEVLSRIRSSGSRTPILMLTARGDTQDRVRGLEMGADDYLSKPFDPAELAARIRAILRRIRIPSDTPVITMDDVALDFGSRTALLKNETLPLTTVEFDLLAALIRAAGTTVSRESLVQDVLGRTFSPFDRSIDTHIYNLRKKLGTLEDGSERIKGIRGTGYLYRRTLAHA